MNATTLRRYIPPNCPVYGTWPPPQQFDKMAIVMANDGKHWIAIYQRHSTLYIMDTQTKASSNSYIWLHNWLPKGMEAVWLSRQIQTESSELCAGFCIFFIYHMLHGNSFNSFRHIFHNIHKNDDIITKFLKQFNHVE